jgi:hypothetical protein
VLILYNVLFVGVTRWDGMGWDGMGWDGMCVSVLLYIHRASLVVSFFYHALLEDRQLSGSSWVIKQYFSCGTSYCPTHPPYCKHLLTQPK